MNMNQKGFVLPVLLITLVIIAGATYFLYLKDAGSVTVKTLSPSPTFEATVVPRATAFSSPSPSFKPAKTLTPTPSMTPSPTPSPRSFEEEEASMRKTIAGFEMYIGTSNTAGALTFFTLPVSDSAKAKLNEIRSKNLPYRLNSWKMVRDANDQYLSTQPINGGFKVQVIECRTNSTSCITVNLELVRNEEAENKFSVSRYYDNSYIYQNNLGEDIKYQGFSF
jgi:hypothetical protein